MGSQITASRRWRSALFWLALVVFIGWDFWQSDAVDLRREPPLIAAGSGQQASGGHCSMKD